MEVAQFNEAFLQLKQKHFNSEWSAWLVITVAKLYCYVMSAQVEVKVKRKKWNELLKVFLQLKQNHFKTLFTKKMNCSDCYCNCFTLFADIIFSWKRFVYMYKEKKLHI